MLAIEIRDLVRLLKLRGESAQSDQIKIQRQRSQLPKIVYFMILDLKSVGG